MKKKPMEVLQPAMPDAQPGQCQKCGQYDHGQTGEYPCAECGLPTLHDGTVYQEPPPAGQQPEVVIGDGSVGHEINLVADPTNTAKERDSEGQDSEPYIEEDAYLYITKAGLRAYLERELVSLSVQLGTWQETRSFVVAAADEQMRRPDYREQRIYEATNAILQTGTKIQFAKSLINLLPFLQADGTMEY